MGRVPEYDRDEILTKAAALFGSLGYAGCSIEDLVQGTGVHRGSLYKAFGSKRGLFVEALRHHVAVRLRRVVEQLAQPDAGCGPEPLAANSEELDLLLVAAVELGRAPVVERQLQEALTALGEGALRGSTSSGTRLRTTGLMLLSCRLAWHATTSDELSHHIQALSIRERHDHDQGDDHR